MAGVHGEGTQEHVDTFVGRVMVRASPVLTWRPTKVQRIRLDPDEPERVTEGSPSEHVASISVVDPPERFARISSRRMVAWPLVQRVESGRGAMLRAFAARAASAVLVAGILAVGSYAAYVALAPGRIVSPVSSKATALHSLRAGEDTLLVAPLLATVEEVRPPPARPAEARPARRKHARRVAAANR